MLKHSLTSDNPIPPILSAYVNVNENEPDRHPTLKHHEANLQERDNID